MPTDVDQACSVDSWGRYVRGLDTVTSRHTQLPPFGSIASQENHAGTAAIQKCQTLRDARPTGAAPWDVTRLFSRGSDASLRGLRSGHPTGR